MGALIIIEIITKSKPNFKDLQAIFQAGPTRTATALSHFLFSSSLMHHTQKQTDLGLHRIFIHAPLSVQILLF